MSNQNEFFLHLTKPEGNKVWEEVDAFMYKNYKFFVNDDGSKRYDENRFCVIDGMVDISNLRSVSKAEMSLVVRMLGLTIPQLATGFCDKPKQVLTMIKFNAMHYYKDGYKFTGCQKVL